MANFHTHIGGSTILGVIYGTVAYSQFGVSAGHASVAGALCAVAGMLPDLDHKLGIPLREMLCFVSIVVPMLMIERFEELGLSPEEMVFVSGVLYVLIRFVGGELFKRFTVHRGMWHSIPAAVLAGMATYLICLSPEEEVRIMKAWAVVLGFMLHLVLDELYSVDLINRRIKKSSGTALKFFGKNSGANLLVYANIIIISGFIASDSMLMDCCRDANAKKIQHEHSESSFELGDGVNSVFDQFRGQAKGLIEGAFEPQFSQSSQTPMVR